MSTTIKTWDFTQGFVYKNWETDQTTDAILADHTKIQDDDGVWHIFGIKQLDADSTWGERFSHITTTDFRNYKWYGDILDVNYADASGNTAPEFAYGAGTVNFIFAPSALENPKYDSASTAITAMRYVMAHTLVAHNAQHIEYVAFAYSNDLFSWHWDTTNTFSILSYNEDGTAKFYWKITHWSQFRDPCVFYDTPNTQYRMSFTASKASGTNAVTGLAEWNSASSTFSEGWTVSATDPYLVDSMSTVSDLEGSTIVRSGSYYYAWNSGRSMWRFSNFTTDLPLLLDATSDRWALTSGHGGTHFGYGAECEYWPEKENWIITSHHSGGANAVYYQVSEITFDDIEDPSWFFWGESFGGANDLHSEWAIQSGSVFSYQPVIADPGQPYKRYSSGAVGDWPLGTRCQTSTYIASLSSYLDIEWKAKVNHAIGETGTAPPTTLPDTSSGQSNTYWYHVDWTANAAVPTWASLDGETATAYVSGGSPAMGGEKNAIIHTGAYCPYPWSTSVSITSDYTVRVGQLKSDNFTVSGTRVKVLMGGAGDATCYVAMYDSAGSLLFKEYGTGSPIMTWRYWNTSDLVGRSCYFEINDGDATPDTGFICVDHFEMYSLDPGESDSVTPTDPFTSGEVGGRGSTTKAALYDSVASKLHLGVETLAPLSAEMDAWALDCLRWLLPLAPEYAVESVINAETGAYGTGIQISSLTNNVLKVVRVTHVDDGDEFIKLSGPQFTAISNQVQGDDFYHALESSVGQGMYGKGQRVWADVDGKIKAYRIAATDELSIGYIAEPSWDTDTLVIPHGWNGLVSSYIAVQVKAKEGDKDQMQFYWKMLKEELSRFQGFEAVSESVGG